jgi:hypothetical protein
MLGSKFFLHLKDEAAKCIQHLTTSEINAIPARLSSEDILQESSVNLQALFAH